MIVNLPDPGQVYEPTRVRNLLEIIRRAFGSAVSSTEAAPCALLQAPDLSVWKVEVTNAGALTATKVQG